MDVRVAGKDSTHFEVGECEGDEEGSSGVQGFAQTGWVWRFHLEEVLRGCRGFRERGEDVGS